MSLHAISIFDNVKMKPWKNAPLTRSLREPGGPCTKSMEVSESRMERVKWFKEVKIEKWLDLSY